jgi:hypothetical protein
MLANVSLARLDLELREGLNRREVMVCMSARVRPCWSGFDRLLTDFDRFSARLYGNVSDVTNARDGQNCHKCRN